MAAEGGIEPPILFCQQQIAFANFATPHHFISSPASFIPRISLCIPIPPPNLGLKSCDKNSKNSKSTLAGEKRPYRSSLYSPPEILLNWCFIS